MIKIFDTHAHLTDEEFNNDRQKIIENLKENNISVLNCGCDEKSSYLCIVLAKKYDFMYAAVGFHPHDAKNYTDKSKQLLKEWALSKRNVAIGEIGLDYHYDYSPRNIQRKTFIDQIQLANELDMPVVVHSRDACEETYEIIRKYLTTKRGAVLHSFSQSNEMLKKYLALDKNIMFSISGPVTFKNADKLRNMVKMIPSERLLAETDCPYLTPVPFRGQRNDPSKVRLIIQKLAEIKNMSYEDMCDLTYKNAEKFFLNNYN